jgi:hypothetical protein
LSGYIVNTNNAARRPHNLESTMSFLAKATKPGTNPAPPIVTVVSPPGAGKTSFAGSFPGALFVQAENAGTVFETWADDVQPTMMPVLPKAAKDDAGNVTQSPFKVLMDQLREVATEDHGYKTLVIDSVTALSRKLEHEIALADNVATVADAAGGFHKGYTQLAGMHSEIIYACEMIRRRKNMAVVFLAHSGVVKIKNRPDEGAEYTVYSLDMHRDSAQAYISNSDAVVYIKKEEFIQGAESNRKGQTTKFGRAMQTGERVLITSGDGLVGYVAAKSRYPMPVEIALPQGENPILQYIPFFQQAANK